MLGAALVSLGEAHLWRGEAALAAPPLAEAMRLLPRGSPRWFVATMRSGWAAMHDTNRDRLLAVAAELAAALEPSPSGPALVAAARVSNQLLCFGYRREAEPFVAALAPVLADPARDPVVAAHALDYTAVRAVFEGDLGTACAGFTACARCFDEVGDVRQAVRVRNNAACMLTELGRLPEAEAELRAVIVSAERLGTFETAATARQSLATVLFHRRALPEARALAEQAVQAFVAQRDPRFEALSRAWLSAIFCEAGDLEAARAEATRAVALCASAPAARCLALAMLARADLASGLHGDACRAAEEATELLDQLGGIEEGEALVRLTLAEALLAAGERAAASAAAASAREALLARAARIVDPAWRRSFLEGVAEHARTLALAAELSVVG